MDHAKLVGNFIFDPIDFLLRGSRKFRPEAEILVIFSIEVAPYSTEVSKCLLVN